MDHKDKDIEKKWNLSEKVKQRAQCEKGNDPAGSSKTQVHQSG